MSNLMLLLHSAGQVADHAAAKALKPTKLTPRQATVLLAIAEHEPVTQTDIVEVTGVDRSTIADVSGRLASQELIERSRDEKDARAYVIMLSEDGARLVKQIRKAYTGVQHDLLGILQPGARETLMKSLDQLSQVSGPIPSAVVSRKNRESNQ